jgi:hypothetical protein
MKHCGTLQFCRKGLLFVKMENEVRHRYEYEPADCSTAVCYWFQTFEYEPADCSTAVCYWFQTLTMRIYHL